MSVFSKLRFYHAALAVLAIAAYLTGEFEAVHPWIGYTLAGVLALRLLMLLAAPRFITPPHWIIRRSELAFDQGVCSPVVGKLLLLGIMLCLFTSISTGVAMHQGWLGAGQEVSLLTTAAWADDDGDDDDEKGGKHNEALEEIHEASSNALLFVVALHIGYLLLLRRGYALSMIFMRGAGKPKAAG